jgi:acetyl/propionyl-CoA carboxylase alpha subunit
MPSPGHIVALRVPAGPGIRDDSGADAGGDVPIYYDPMISKLIAWGDDRRQAIARLRRALREYDVLGIKTTVPFFRWMLEQPDFTEARFHTAYLDEVLRSRAGQPFTLTDEERTEVAVIAAAIRHTTGGSRVSSVPADKPGASQWKVSARSQGLRN